MKDYNKIRNLPSVNTQPSANANCIFVLPLNKKYHKFFIYFKDASGVRTEAELRAEVVHMQLVINGKNKSKLLIADLIAMQEYHRSNDDDLQTDDGVLCFDLTRANFRLPEQLEALGLGTLDLDSAQLEVKFGATVGATEISGYAEVSGNTIPGLINCYRNKSGIAYGSVGTKELIDLPNTEDIRVMAYHINDGAASGVISDVEYEVNDEELVSLVPVAVLHNRCRKHGRTPQTGYAHLDFSLQGRISDGLKMRGEVLPSGVIRSKVDSHALRVTFSTAPTLFSVITETIESAI